MGSFLTLKRKHLRCPKHSFKTYMCLYKQKRLTIYTDSCDAFNICHAFGMLWIQRGYLTFSGKCIANTNLITDLLSSLQLPKALAVMHCSAHTCGIVPVSRENEREDSEAKLAALKGPEIILTLTITNNFDLSLSHNDHKVGK